MTWPQHKNPSSENRTAHAPYNFVPLPERIITVDDLPRQDRYDDNRYTGYLECTLTTKSPLYVRCGLTLKQFDEGKESKDLPEFFYINPDTKEPIIPGSSLRGMLRTLVEIVGYAKVQPVSRQKIFYRAVADQMTTLRESYHRQMQNVEAGYVEENDGEFAIRSAKMIKGNTFFKVTERVLEEGGVSFTSIFASNYRPQYVECWFRPSDKFSDSVGEVSSKPKPGYKKGVLICSGRFGKKKRKHWIVPEKDGSATPVLIPESTVIEYIDTLTPYQKQKPFSDKVGCLVKGRPIFYLEENGKVIDFGPTRNFRVAYRALGQSAALSSQDFVPADLRDPNVVDLAEAMFGFVKPKTKKEQKDLARAGRIFVSDALLADGQSPDKIWLAGDPNTVTIPRILSGPKPTTFAHYLTQRKPERIKVRGKRKDRYILGLDHYASPTPDETVIRGHKLYWHKGNASRKQIQEPDQVGPKDTQHSKIKPIHSGVHFRFCVRFENLSQVEIGALLWALTLPGPGEYCHKLGMGKPLGMGAVKIESELHLTDRQVRYQELFSGDSWELGLDVGYKGKDSQKKKVKVDTKKRRLQALKAFEQVVLKHNGLDPGEAQSLAEVHRIRDLLAMLSWPGPPPSKTEYITDLREFTKRKVLPTPLAVIGVDAVPPLPVQPVPLARSEEPIIPLAPISREDPLVKKVLPLVPGPHTGTVNYFNLKDGVGRILPDGSDVEIEIQINQLRTGVRYLVKEQRVSFTVVQEDVSVRLEDVWPI